MDVSSEMIHALLPVFLVSVLGASALAVGAIEGGAEATASIVKIFSGTLSDYLGKRKLLAAIGYSLSACSKPLFPLASTAGLVFLARFADRIGKGIRGAPRDALIGEIAPSERRGAAYGLRQSLDTAGAFIGPLLATLLMALTADDYRLVFWLAVIPAFCSAGLITFGVAEPERAPATSAPKAPTRRGDIRALGSAYWWLIIVASAFTLARFSEAFLLLRASNVGVTPALLPLVLVAMNVVYSLAAYPAGILSDRLGRSGLLQAGFAMLIASDLVLAFGTEPLVIVAGVALWGLHMGLTQGIFAALVADTTPEALRGTAFGLFNLASGVAALLASLLAGVLWESFGPPATFLCGAGLTLLALAGALLLRPRRST